MTGKQFSLLLPCAVGVEKYLVNEVTKLGFEVKHKEAGRVSLQTGLEGVYRLVRSTRMAERVLLECASFKASSFEQFYQGVRDVHWQDYLPADVRLHIDKVRVHKCALGSVSSLQSMAQKAVYDALMRHHRLQTMSETGPVLALRIYGDQDYFRVALDLSGEALHKRGWRRNAGRAPLKETIAATMVLANVWRRKTPLHDPCCGSGTLCLEALAYAANLAPNLYRPLALGHMTFHQASLDSKVQAELRGEARFDTLVRIKGSDRDASVIETARENLEQFCVTYRLGEAEREWVKASLQFAVADVDDVEAWAAEGLLLTNPPYGERMEPLEQARELLARLGALQSRLGDWSLSLVTTDKEAPAAIGGKSDWTRVIHNGALELILYHFPGARQGA